MIDELREELAELLWRAAYLCATGKKCSVPWEEAEVEDERYLASAVLFYLATIGLSAQAIADIRDGKAIVVPVEED